MNGRWHVVRRVPEMPAESHALYIIFLAGIYNMASFQRRALGYPRVLHKVNNGYKTGK